ncbi:MFS transporter [Dehalococcoidia bacterium]|nr:MFS transporter [Dehalococcoidia bacterium]
MTTIPERGDETEDSGLPLTTSIQGNRPIVHTISYLQYGLRRTFSALNHRNYRLYWTSQVGFFGAHWMDNIARNWLVWDLTGSALSLAMVNLCRALPDLVLTLPAGVIADRFNKRVVVLACQIVAFFCYLSLTILVLSGLVQLWHIYAISAIHGSAMGFNQPARQSLVPRLVPRQELLNAMALNHIAMNTTRIVGPAIAGLIVAGWGVGMSFVAATLVAIIPIVAMSMLRVHIGELESPTKLSVIGQMREGVSFFIRNPVILSIAIVAMATFTFGMTYTTIIPVIADEVFDIGAKGYGLLLSISGAGALVGGVVLAALGDPKHKGYIFMGGALMFGVCVMGLGVSAWTMMGLAFVAMVGLGASQTFFMTTGNALILNQTPAELQGRVMSVYHLDRALIPLGTAAVGGLTDLIGAPVVLVTMGVILTGLILIIAATQKALIRL